MYAEIIYVLNNLYCLILMTFTSTLFSRLLLGKPKRFWTPVYVLLLPVICSLIAIFIGTYFSSSLFYICTILYPGWGFRNHRLPFRFFVGILTLILYSILSCIQCLFGKYTGISALYDTYDPWYALAISLYFFIIIAVFYLVYFLLKRKKILDINPLIPLIIFPSLLYLYLLFIITDYLSAVIGDLFLTIVFICAVVGSILSYIFAIRLSNSLKDKAVLEQKLDFMEQYKELSADYSNLVKENLNEIHKIRHDFNNSIQVIQGMIAQGRLEDAAQFSAQLQEEYTKLPNEVFCENITINTILQQEQRNCEKNGILLQTSCVVPKELPVSQVNLCSILTNLLQNAERAVLDMTSQENSGSPPVITLSVWMEGDMLFFKVKNPKQNPVIVQNGKLVTTKSDKKHHGLGMEIVRQIAAQYDGDVFIQHHADDFSVLVELCLAADDSKK